MVVEGGVKCHCSEGSMEGRERTLGEERERLKVDTDFPL